MRFLVCCALAAFSLSGCGVMKRPLDLGGSKGDGTVILGANVDEFDRVNWDGAQSKARKRCTAWGYRDTEAFAGRRHLPLSDCAGEGTGEKWWSETSVQQCRSGSIKANTEWLHIGGH